MGEWNSNWSRVARLADEAHGALGLPRQRQLDDDRLERDALLEHHPGEHAVDHRQRRRQRLLHTEVEHRLLHRGHLDRALLEAADRLRHREHTHVRVACGVLVHADGGDEAAALLVALAHFGTEHPRRDHADIAGGGEADRAREGVPASDDREAVGRAHDGQ